MKVRKFVWFFVLAVVLGLSYSAAAGEVKSVDQVDFDKIQAVSLSVTQPASAQRVVALTSEIPVKGMCTGTPTHVIKDKPVELCAEYSIEVPRDAKGMAIEIELPTAGRNIHFGFGNDRPIGQGGSFWTLRGFGDPLKYGWMGYLEKEDLRPGTWYFAIFNFERARQEYTFTVSLTPVTLSSGVPHEGSIADNTLGGMYDPRTQLWGYVDYMIHVPSADQVLRVRLENRDPSGDIDLAVRFGQPVAIEAGSLRADFVSAGSGGIEVIEISPRSSPPLRSGIYYIKVANNVPTRQRFMLTATVGPAVRPPVIGVSPDRFSFRGVERGPNPPAQTLAITNAGGETLSWTARAVDAPWLRLSPTSGSAPPPSSVSVSVDLAGLAPRTFEGRIVIEAPGATNSPFSVPVTLIVETEVRPPLIGVEPGSLSFSAVERGANPSPQTLRITNAGGGTLSWTVRVVDAPWLRLSPTSGSAPPPSTVSVSVDIAGLAAGSYAGRIVIEAPGATNSPLSVPVTLTITIRPPVIGVSPDRFSFRGVERGPNPPAQTLTITNAGGGALSWTVRAVDAPWLRLSPTSGSAPPPSSVSVSVDLAGLAPRTFEGRIVIEAPGATNSPFSVPVTLIVETEVRPPLIGVEPGSLSFSAVERGANPSPQTLRITNAGGGTLSWTVRAVDAPWLRLSPTSGSAPPPSTVSVSVDIAGLAAGSYAGRIVIEAPGATNSPLSVPVTLTITTTRGQLIALKFIKLEFVVPTAWERTLKEGCVVYKNVSGAPSKIKVTLPDNSVLEFDIPAAKEVLVCGDVVHIDTRS